MSKADAPFPSSKVIKALKTKTCTYLVTTAKHHVGIYANNTAIVMERQEDLPLLLVPTKKGGVSSTSSPLFSTVEAKLDGLAPMLLPTAPCDPEALGVTRLLPASKIKKGRKGAAFQESFSYGSPDTPLFSFQWKGAPWTLLYANPELDSILGVLTTSTYDVQSITYVDKIYCDEGIAKVDEFLSRNAVAPLLSVDTETFDPIEPGGWRALSHRHGRVRSLQIWNPRRQEGIFIDFGGRGLNVYSAALSNRLAAFFVDKRLVFHNALFDMGMLQAQLDISVQHSAILDTQIMSQNLWAGLRIMPHSLGAVASRLGVGMSKEMQTSDFGAPLIPAQIQYGMDDTRATAEIMVKLGAALKKDGANLGSAKIDCDYLHALHTMRTKGYPVNTCALNAAIEQMEAWLLGKSEEFMALAGVKYTQRDLVLAALQRLYPSEHITSTNKAELASRGHLPAVQLLTDCKFVGVRLAYAKSVQDAITPQGTACGGFRSLANQGMGRTACSAKIGGKSGVFVQLQNPAKADKRYADLPDLRKVFVGGRNQKRGVDRKLIIADLKSAHLLLSHEFSNELDQINLANEPGADSHSYNAAIVVRTALSVSGNPEYTGLDTYAGFLEAKNNESKTAKRVRDLSKNAIYTKINFGSAWSLQSTIKKFGQDIDFETCELVMEGIGEAIPKWTAYCKKALKEANLFDFDFSHLYKSIDEIRQTFIDDGIDDPDELDDLIEEIKRKRPSSFGYYIGPSGRGRYVPKYTRKGRYGDYESAKIGDVSAFILQAVEADIMKVAGTRFDNWAKLRFINEERDVDCWLAVIAHDEYVIIVDADHAEEAGRKLHEIISEEARKFAPRLKLVEPWVNEDYIKDNWSEK